MKKLVAVTALLSLNATAFAGEFKANVSGITEENTFANDYVLNALDCHGKNISPEIKWENAPKDTKAFAVTLYDVDGPSDSGFWHWLAFNIPANVNLIPKGASKNTKLLPKGTIESRTDFIKSVNGEYGYGGACPPKGDNPHKYVYKITALKDKIPLNKDASPAFVSYYIRQLKIAESVIEVHHGR